MPGHKCPSCGGDGGILLFTHVAPCDACRSAGDSGLRVVIFTWHGLASLPPGTAGFDIAGSKLTATQWRDSILGSIRAGTPLSEWDADRLSLGKLLINAAKSKEEFSGHYGKPAVAVCRASPTTDQRAPRIVGAVPDPWHGASARHRWAEGRPIRMILRPEDVPAVAVLHSWMQYQHSSAPDCMFKDLQESLRMHLRRHQEWNNRLPTESRDGANKNLKQDYVLLVVD